MIIGIHFTCAVAEPEGNFSFSLRIVCFRNGTAKKTPKNATDKVQRIICHPLKSKLTTKRDFIKEFKKES